MKKIKVNLKDLVKTKYGEIARQTKPQNQSSCCGPNSCCSDVDYTVFSENYDRLTGYLPDADLGLGCGLPTEHARIKTGDHVLDLGSGAGNDCFVARSLTGETGFITGLDFTDEMIHKAGINKQKSGFTNMEFVKGDIEDMPFGANTFDVIISNCVLNLVPDKVKAFSEIFRVLKPGGHFCVSDVVLKGTLPHQLKEDAEMYAGCVAGAIAMEEYVAVVTAQGFMDVVVCKEKNIDLPSDILSKYLNPDELEEFRSGKSGIKSITVRAYKPAE